MHYCPICKGYKFGFLITGQYEEKGEVAEYTEDEIQAQNMPGGIMPAAQTGSGGTDKVMDCKETFLPVSCSALIPLHGVHFKSISLVSL